MFYYEGRPESTVIHLLCGRVSPIDAEIGLAPEQKRKSPDDGGVGRARAREGKEAQIGQAGPCPKDWACFTRSLARHPSAIPDRSSDRDRAATIRPTEPLPPPLGSGRFGSNFLVPGRGWE